MGRGRGSGLSAEGLGGRSRLEMKARLGRGLALGKVLVGLSAGRPGRNLAGLGNCFTSFGSHSWNSAIAGPADAASTRSIVEQLQEELPQLNGTCGWGQVYTQVFWPDDVASMTMNPDLLLLGDQQIRIPPSKGPKNWPGDPGVRSPHVGDLGFWLSHLGNPGIHILISLFTQEPRSSSLLLPRNTRNYLGLTPLPP